MFILSGLLCYIYLGNMSQLQNHTRGRRDGCSQECSVETEGGMILVIFQLFILHDQIAYTTNAILNSLLKGYKLCLVVLHNQLHMFW